MTSFGPTRRRLATAAVGTLALISASAATPAFSTHPADTARATHDDTARQTYQRLVSDADASKRAATDPVRLDLLAINDFHGNLDTIDPKVSSSGRINNTPAGGVAFLARHLKNLRSQAAANGASTLTVAAGDLIGASPLLSAAFHDEPTIEAMNKIGLQVASVGNHEFDEGYRELLRMQRGGCIDDGPDGENNQNSCPDHEFEGADFKYLAANVKYDDDKPHDGQSIFPGYKIERVNGIKVGFIGMTLKDTPTIVTASGVAGPEVHRRGRHRQPVGAEARGEGREGDRGAAAPGRDSQRPDQLRRLLRRHRRRTRHRAAARPADRRDHQRPHAPGLQLHGAATRPATRAC